MPRGWSVLNDSIQDALIGPPDDMHTLAFIRWDLKRIDALSIQNALASAQDFAKVFCLASDQAYLSGPDMRKIFISGLNALRERYGDYAIDKLQASVADAAYVPVGDRRYAEAFVVDRIVQGFEDIFPELVFVGKEVWIGEDMRVDILARELLSGRDVIMEVKLGARDPTKQLLKYARGFSNPVLLGITEKQLRAGNRNARIEYVTFGDLNRRAIGNIKAKFSGAF